MEQSPWLKELDTQLKQFILECCDIGEGHYALSNKVYWAYYRWAKAKGRLALNAMSFHYWMEHLGYRRKRFERRLFYIGLEPKQGAI